MELTTQQKDVFSKVKAFMKSDTPIFILRGYAGTGKTTMVKIIADYISQNNKKENTVPGETGPLLMAPTGRAARVLTQKTEYKASTIHKTIYGDNAIVVKKVEDIADSHFKFVFPIRKHELTEQVVAIVDEASMVCSRKVEHELFMFGSDNILDDLLEFTRPHYGGKIIFVGDPAQLPPVGESASNALKADYFEGRGLKVMEAELTEVLRQQGESVILKNAMMIRNILEKEKRNYWVFEEKKNDVEAIPPECFLKKYIEYRKASDKHDSVIICYSNRAASKYNEEVRTALYGCSDSPLQINDILLICQNNYSLGRMNGEFVPVLNVGERVAQSAPVYVQSGGQKQRVTININFIYVTVLNDMGVPAQCLLIEDLLTSDRSGLSIDENRALYVNFCIRHSNLKQGTKEFGNALKADPFYNAIRAKYGYAVTGHKCQGGEWGKVFVDYSGRTGLDDDSLRWAYTATTRAQKMLYFTNLPHITPFSRFRIAPIERCKNIDAECRVTGYVAPTPFHTDETPAFLRAKYWCIVRNMEYSPYRILSVISRPYMEIYHIQTPTSTERFDIHYKTGGIFMPTRPASYNEHTQLIMLMLNDERQMPFVFNYKPSDDIREKLYNMIRSACDSLSVQLTNVVEHTHDYCIIYYMRTCNTYSYLKVYIDKNNFVTYARPMSMIGNDDTELGAVINEIKNHMIE